MAVSAAFWKPLAASAAGFHVTTMRAARDRLLVEGFDPAGRRSRFLGGLDHLASRPGHSYLSLPHGFWPVWEQSFGALPRSPEGWSRLIDLTVMVDLPDLNPLMVSQDEACCFESTLTFEVGSAPITAPGVPLAEEVTADPECSPPSTSGPLYASYGAWAEGVDLGSDVPSTERTISVFGSIAYRGKIPATALAPLDHHQLLHLRRLVKDRAALRR